MKKLFSVLLVLAMLASLSVPAFAEPDYSSGTPWPCIDLEGVVTEDMEAELKDNFALAVNKEKILSTEIPEGYPTTGTMYDINFIVQEQLKDMFLGGEPEGHDAKLACHLFQLLMDWDSRNAAGVAPLKALTDAVEALDSLEALNAYFTATPASDWLSSLYSCGSDIDFVDSTRYCLIVGECGLLLGDSAEYSELTDYGAIKKAAYSELAEKMLVKLGYTPEQARRKLDNCLAYETLLAPAVYTNEEAQQPDYLARILNTFSLDELRQAQGKLPILETLAGYGFPEAEEYRVMHPAFLEKLNELYTEENLPLIRDYMIVHGVISRAGSLDRECYEWMNDCDNAISGATGILDDETVFSSAVAATLAWPVARLYTQTYLKQEDKDRIAAMIDELLDAYHGIIDEADFLSDETRAKAIEKLDAIEPRVLYPDSWERYACDGLDFASPAEGGTLWDAIKSISDYLIAKAVKDYAEPVDKEYWSMPPQIVNCCYGMQDNTVTVMGASAQGGLYNSAMSDEELLGKLGVLIGHEISHAFDSNGAQFDKDGNMSDWWTEDDYNAFLARNQKMADYYDAMHPWEGQDFYGSIMTGEACADMAGMKVVLRVAAEREDFDFDAFFRAYADLWFCKDTLQRAYVRINDVHPMQYLRINTVLQQFDEFLDFYGITEGDGMYLAPADRVYIW